MGLLCVSQELQDVIRMSGPNISAVIEKFARASGGSLIKDAD